MQTPAKCFQIDQSPLGLSREYLIKGLDDKLVQAYHSYQIDTAVIYGANRIRAESEMSQVLDFEIELAKVRFEKFTKSFKILVGKMNFY